MIMLKHVRLLSVSLAHIAVKRPATSEEGEVVLGLLPRLGFG